MSGQVKKDFQNSLDDSWATISVSEDSGNLCELSEPENLLQPVNNNYNNDEADLDETIPIDEIDTPDGLEPIVYVDVRHPAHMPTSRSKSDFLWGTPIPPKEMQEFRPVYCSPSKNISSFDFSPQFCSSKLDSHQSVYSNNGALSANRPQQRHAKLLEKCLKHPAPIIREIAKLKPHLRSMSSSSRIGSEEFRPQRCSTALSESELKLRHCATELEENSALFIPLRSSTQITKNTRTMMPSIPNEFEPIRCSTGLQENSVAFMPLRCSTGLNDSATFNPPLSSTCVKLENSNIPEFKLLKLQSENNFVLQK